MLLSPTTCPSQLSRVRLLFQAFRVPVYLFSLFFVSCFTLIPIVLKYRFITIKYYYYVYYYISKYYISLLYQLSTYYCCPCCVFWHPKMCGMSYELQRRSLINIALKKTKLSLLPAPVPPGSRMSI